MTIIRLSGDGSGFFFVDKIGEGEELRFGVEDGDGKVAGADEFVDDAVDGGEELLEILYGAGFLGDFFANCVQNFGRRLQATQRDHLRNAHQRRGGEAVGIAVRQQLRERQIEHRVHFAGRLLIHASSNSTPVLSISLRPTGGI